MKRFVRVAEAEEAFGEARIGRLREALSLEDPPADRLMQVLLDAGLGRGMAWVDEALESGASSSHPPELRELLERQEAFPLDPEGLDAAGRAVRRAAPVVIAVFKGASLPYTYAPPAANKPLVLTGRLRDDAKRRLDETGRFAFLIALPDALTRFGEGFAVCTRVRLMHAAVRRQMHASPDWSPDWGEPINQLDMAFTALLFSTVILDGLRRVGVHISDEEGEQLMRLNTVMGHLLGVEPDLQCRTEAEGRALFDAIRMTSERPDDDARALMDALFEAQVPSLRPYYRGISQALLGEQLAQDLGVNGDVRWFEALREFASRADRVLHAVSAQDLAAEANTHLVRFLVDRALGDQPARFDPA